MWPESRGGLALVLPQSRRAPAASPGHAVRQWQAAQAEAADIDHFVIYRHEWLQGGTTLGPYGRYHLQEINKRLRHVPYPVLIQVDPDEHLNVARRLGVVSFLLEQGVSDAEQRVVVGFPQAEGLYADEAARIFLQGYQGSGAGGFGGLGGTGGVTGGSLSTGGLGTSFGTGFGGGFRGY